MKRPRPTRTKRVHLTCPQCPWERWTTPGQAGVHMQAHGLLYPGHEVARAAPTGEFTTCPYGPMHRIERVAP